MVQSSSARSLPSDGYEASQSMSGTTYHTLETQRVGVYMFRCVVSLSRVCDGRVDSGPGHTRNWTKANGVQPDQSTRRLVDSTSAQQNAPSASALLSAASKQVTDMLSLSWEMRHFRAWSDARSLTSATSVRQSPATGPSYKPQAGSLQYSTVQWPQMPTHSKTERDNGVTVPEACRRSRHGRAYGGNDGECGAELAGSQLGTNGWASDDKCVYRPAAQRGTWPPSLYTQTHV